MGCRLGVEFDAKGDAMSIDLATVILTTSSPAKILQPESEEFISTDPMESNMRCLEWSASNEDAAEPPRVEVAVRHRSLAALNASYSVSGPVPRFLTSTHTADGINKLTRHLIDLSNERRLSSKFKGRGVRKKSSRVQSSNGKECVAKSNSSCGVKDTEAGKGTYTVNGSTATGNTDSRNGIVAQGVLLHSSIKRPAPLGKYSPRSPIAVRVVQKNVASVTFVDTTDTNGVIARVSACAAIVDKKRVSFADDFGKSLFEVRLMEEQYEALGSIDNGDPNGSTGEEPDAMGCEPDNGTGWVPAFKPPASNYASFRAKLCRQHVALENVSVQGFPQFRLQGTIKVKNVCFEKYVFVRWSADNWASTEDTAAYFAASLPGDDYDTFAFDFETFPKHNQIAQIDFCVGFRADGCEYWDNNDNTNFSICRSTDKRIRLLGLNHAIGISDIVQSENFVELVSWPNPDVSVPYY